MKSIELGGKARENTSKAGTRELRKADMVPCVLYGGAENVHFQCPELDFRKLIYTPSVYTVSLDVDGKKYDAVMQEVQFHPITDKILHVDFLELKDDKPVKISIPVNLVGTSEGVKQGGKLHLKMRKIAIKALPKDLPDAIELNIEPLDIGDAIRIKDINIPGVEFQESPNNMVVAVRVTRKVVEEVPEEAVTTEGAPAEGAPAEGAAPAEGGAPADDKKKKEAVPSS